MQHKTLHSFILIAYFTSTVTALSTSVTPNKKASIPVTVPSRKTFLEKACLCTVGTLAGTWIVPGEAEARGRATLEQAYDRYSPRIKAGGEFYKGDLKGILSKGDWAALRDATAEPPKRTKEDKAKADGGIAERAAKAGGFSDARVLTACDLYAATFSDNSISAKTTSMKAQVEIMRKVVQEMNKSAKIALGEEKADGGLFGIGGKKPSANDLMQNVRKLYVEGGNAYNQYIFDANEGLPVTLEKLPYL